MIEIRRSAIVRYNAARMYALVNDVEAYPRRFNWCAEAHILASDEASLTARLTVRVAGMTQSFTTRNELAPPNRITLRLVEGPFRALSGAWNFTELGEHGCKIALSLDFDYAGSLMAPVMRLGFEKLADRMVDDFSREADRSDA